MNLLMQIVNKFTLLLAEKLHLINSDINPLIVVFFIANGVTALIMFITSRYATDFKRLSDKGLSKEYIRLNIILHQGMNYKILFIFILSQLFMGTLLFFMNGSVSPGDFNGIFMVSFVIMIISMIIIRNAYRDRIRELILMKKANITIDFKFGYLKYILKLPLEIVVITGIFYFNFMFFENGLVLYSLAVIPYGFCCLLKYARNFTEKSMSRDYIYITLNSIFIQTLRLVFFFNMLFKYLPVISNFSITLGFVVGILIFTQLVLSAQNYPKLKSVFNIKSPKKSVTGIPHKKSPVV